MSCTLPQGKDLPSLAMGLEKAQLFKKENGVFELEILNVDIEVPFIKSVHILIVKEGLHGEQTAIKHRQRIRSVIALRGNCDTCWYTR